MFDDTIERFSFPAVDRKKLTAACDGGRITPDGGVMLLAAAERRSGIARHLAGLIADTRDPALVTHSLADILRARMLVLSQTSHVDPANLTPPGNKAAALDAICLPCAARLCGSCA